MEQELTATIRRLRKLLGQGSSQNLEALELLRIIEERSRTLEAQLRDSLILLRATEERSQTLEAQLQDSLTLLRATEERSQTLEAQLQDSLTLLHATEERTRTLEYQSDQILFAANYQIDLLQKWYVESMPATSNFRNKKGVTAAGLIRLETAHPLAIESRDHIAPDSTAEGLIRPTEFVRHCIDILGPGIRCLDLGAGSAGLVFEFVMNDVVSIGVDGSDFCRKNKIGYWPLLTNNLYTCDITHPFRFIRAQEGTPVNFHIITMWEVLEHITETDLVPLLQNVVVHLEPSGYFLGSISLVEYNDANGVPYHVTLKPKPWWKKKFRENGLIMLEKHPFDQHLFCRGNGPRFQDLHNYFFNPGDGFHFVAQKTPR